MDYKPLTPEAMHRLQPGEALTLATVTLVFTIVILAVVAYKLFTSGKAKLEIPGGYKFEWSGS